MNKNIKDSTEKRFNFIVRLLSITNEELTGLLGHPVTCPISYADASLLSDHANKKNISCSLEWIMSGESNHPPLKAPSSYFSPLLEYNNMLIVQELEALKRIHPDLEFLILNDDSMLPHFAKGDYVGGNIVEENTFKKYLDFTCIIETKDFKRRLRRLGCQDGAYFLYATNTRHRGSALFEFDPQISMLAPVFWHRLTNL